MAGFLQLTVGLLLLFARPCCAELNMYDARLCYILDGFLAVYGLVITGLYVHEKLFTSKKKARGKRQSNRSQQEEQYTELNVQSSNDVYRELPAPNKGRRQRSKDQQIYQDLNQARDLDTYNTLQSQPVPPGR